MNRIEKCFALLENEGRKAVMPFITAGCPDMSATERAALDMLGNGADIIIMGVPFSDPIAESVSVQKSSLLALKNGCTLDRVFTAVENIRRGSDKPIVLMMYLNTIFAYGTEKFFSICRDKGIDGVIVPDMPYEERDEIQKYADSYGVMSITTAAPASEERLRMISSGAKGFIYCDITEKSDKAEAFFKALDRYASCPFCAAADSEKCGGTVIGGSLMDVIAENPDNAGSFIREISESRIAV